MQLKLAHTDVLIRVIRVYDVTDSPATEQGEAFTKMVLADADGDLINAYLTPEAKRGLIKGLNGTTAAPAENALDYLTDIANLPDGQTVTLNAEDARRILGSQETAPLRKCGGFDTYRNPDGSIRMVLYLDNQTVETVLTDETARGLSEELTWD